MSELIIEHPIAIIDYLLKIGKGDKGRLLYLKKALIDGKTIYESDKKYLKQMQKDLSDNKNFTNTSDSFKDKNELHFKQNGISKSKTIKSNKITSSFYPKNEINNTDHQIKSIQTLIDDIKTKDSKIKNNLELLLVNREIYSKNLKSDSSFDCESLCDNVSPSSFWISSSHSDNSKKFSFLGLKRHDLLAYASAGLFSLWFASYMNLINLGSMKGITFGLSAGSALAAGLFFKKSKKD